MISIKSFSLMRPKVDARLISDSSAQSATNCVTESGKLRALFKPLRVAFSHNNPPLSIFKQRNSSWLDWATDVDVIRSPLDTTPDTLIFTGNGRPKIKAEGSTTEYFLGLPAPVAAPVATNNPPGDIKITSMYAVGAGYVELPRSPAPTTVGGNKDSYPFIDYSASPLNVTADGVNNIKFRVYAWITGVPENDSVGDPARNKTLLVYVYRDGVLSQTVAFPNDVWMDRPEDIGGQPPTNHRAVSFLEVVPKGTYTYTFKLRLAGPELGYSGTNVGLIEVYSHAIVRARKDGITDVITQTPHGLSVDSDVNISGVKGVGEFEYLTTWVDQPGFAYGTLEVRRIDFASDSGTTIFSALSNSKTFRVVEVVSPTEFIIDELIEGQYVSGGTFKQTWSAQNIESRTYLYTYVATINGVDYEGPASPASEVIDSGQGQGVTITGFSTFPVTWESPVDRIRVYRFNPSQSTGGAYQFAGEIPASSTSFVDNVLGSNLGETLADPDMTPPVESLKGIIELPNGGAAAFSGKTIYLAIPNLLHAWPSAYARNCHDEIMAIGAFGNSIAIATKSNPYVLTGVDPSAMSMDKVELSQPCLSKRGCVDFGYAWVYPSPDGLVLITSGRADVVTEPLISEVQWRQLNPASFNAARYENKYVCFYQDLDGNKGGFILNPLDLDYGMVWLDIWADAVWTDQSDGRLYIARGTNIQRFDDDEVEMAMRWRSKDFVTPSIAMTAGRVEAKKYPVSISVFCDGQELMAAQIYSRNAFRIGNPVTGQIKGEVWSVEIRGQHDVQSIYLAENMQSLGRSFGGA